jgi:hypothetical protein
MYGIHIYINRVNDQQDTATRSSSTIFIIMFYIKIIFVLLSKKHQEDTATRS